VTFNSFWPATGQRPLHVNNGRTITLQQLSEQAKDSLVNVRPNGEFRINATTWGRETIGNAVIGNVCNDDPQALLSAAERQFRASSVGQLPREAEAVHKFQLGEQDTNARIAASTAKIVFLPRFLVVQFETPAFLPGGLDTRELGVRIYQVTVNGRNVTDQVLWDRLAHGPEQAGAAGVAQGGRAARGAWPAVPCCAVATAPGCRRGRR